MKTINFTQTGGFPLTQDGLDYMQQAYSEGLLALSQMGSDGSSPVIISGMAITTPAAGTVAVADGWIWYNNEMIQFTGSTVTPSGTDVPLVAITAGAVPLTYNDGAVHNAMFTKTASLTSGTAVTDAYHFPLSAAQPFQLVFGRNAREAAWNSIVVNTASSAGSVAGTLYYKKNILTNTLHIRATLTANTAQNFVGAPAAIFTLIATLPTGYLPASSALFTTYYYAPNLFKDDLGVSWVKQLTSAINTSGQMYINFLRPESSVLAYSVVFNTIIPLD